MTAEDDRATAPDRRTMLLLGAAGGLSLPLLAACGGGSSSTAGPPPSAGGSTGSPRPGAGHGGSGAGSKAAPVLGPTSDVPVGGGHVFGTQKVVVTQPTQGEFKAFSAVCTHQGCLVSSVSGGEIHCPCHGSSFSIKDGSVSGGPAPSPLPAERIKVAKGTIELA